jgi:hypothetical protein
MIGKTTSLSFGPGRPLLGVVVFCVAENDEHGSALVVTLDYDEPASSYDRAVVLGTVARSPGKVL